LDEEPARVEDFLEERLARVALGVFWWRNLCVLLGKGLDIIILLSLNFKVTVTEVLT